MEEAMHIILGGAAAGVALSCGAAGALCAVAAAWPAVRRALRRKVPPEARMAAFAFAAGAALYGGGKGVGRVQFPRTDADVQYLVDRGSYVTNDLVHIDFLRAVVPATAAMYVDRYPVSVTNEAEIAAACTNQVESTFEAMPPPFDIPFPAATGYHWLVYTDWTPAPAVQTNGVWHAWWGRDRRTGRHMIPVRTCVREDGEVIATPRSREGHLEDQEGEESR